MNLDTVKDFFRHVFDTSDDSKSEMMNILQYSLVAIIPIVMLNKTMSKYVPEANERKGSLELIGEVTIQIAFMMIGLLLIHRINTFVPTLSGEEYPDFSIIYVISSVLMIVLSLQTKLGDKVSILSDRMYALWEGKEGMQSQSLPMQPIRSSQPLSTMHGQMQQSVSQMPTSSMPLSSSGTTLLTALPQSSLQPNVPVQQPYYQPSSAGVMSDGGAYYQGMMMGGGGGGDMFSDPSPASDGTAAFGSW